MANIEQEQGNNMDTIVLDDSDGAEQRLPSGAGKDGLQG